MAHPLTNFLLETLPFGEKAKIMLLLTPVALPLGAVLYEARQTPHYVHFLTSGLTSMVTTMSGGDAVEVGLSGREGLPEALYLLGPERGENRSFMQVAGTGLRMEFQPFEQLFQQNDALRRLALRYVQFQMLVSSQLTACNRLHEVEERLARWLLTVSDLTGEPHVQLTQEFLSMMLGSRRSTVTIAAGTLQRSGMIEYHRGNVNIVDRESLEDAACECYPVVRRLFHNLYK